MRPGVIERLKGKWSIGVPSDRVDEVQKLL